MWHNTRRGNNLIRKRYNVRKFKLNLLNSLAIIACSFIILLCIVKIYKLNSGENKIENPLIISSNNKVNIYDETDVTPKIKEFKITALGEIMMGSPISENLGYNYMSAFKTITEYTKSSDYTVANLTTNITELEKIKDAKSKYIVTSKIANAFNALGIDGINLASDHMLDFGKDVFIDTKNIIKKDYDLIGLKDTIMYAEHDGIKVAFIGVTNEVIGIQEEYTDAGIMAYNMKKLKQMIKDAKKQSNTVVLMTHLGLENTRQITSIMSWFYKELIDAGADMVLGSHALGMYPIELYKGKPIIYSLGYLMHDTDYLVGKESGILNFTVNKNGKITKIEIIPTYINAKKQTLIYKEYNKKQNIDFIKYLTSKIKGAKYTIKNDKVELYLT